MSTGIPVNRILKKNCPSLNILPISGKNGCLEYKIIMYKLVFFVPEEQKEKVKNALFGLGAGRLGNYSCCSWECEGTGQFMPMEGSRPFLGEKETLERVKEFRVEMLVREDLIPLCIETLKVHHPYEEPAYEFLRVYQNEETAEADHWL